MFMFIGEISQLLPTSGTETTSGVGSTQEEVFGTSPGVVVAVVIVVVVVVVALAVVAGLILYTRQRDREHECHGHTSHARCKLIISYVHNSAT